MSQPAIEVSGLSKKYVIEHESRHDNLRDTLHHAARKLWRRARWGTGFETEEFWALRDVTFTVQPGEVIGIIGRNGAGKSTLLKLLSRITEPTEGRITLRGRVASLLEVGTGFHPDLTGRENIFLNGAILGMSRVEIRRKFDEIVAFAEIERFIDTPVKRYSSGMYVRLAFAVAAHLEPEILIVDEVLAVGDAQFQKKCLGKMKDVSRREGRTILLVSHNMSAIRNLCGRGLYLERGQQVAVGTVDDCIEHYLRPSPQSSPGMSLNRSGDGRLRFTGLHIENGKGERVGVIASGEACILVFSYENHGCKSGQCIDVGFGLHASTGERLLLFYTAHVNQVFSTVHENGEFRCHLPGLPLATGSYGIYPRIEIDSQEADFPHDGLGTVDVEELDFYGTGKSMANRLHGHAHYLIKGSWSECSASPAPNHA